MTAATIGTERLADICGRRLALIADRDPSIWVLDGDLADSDGAHHFAARHPERFINAGIAEQNMVTVAAGMATGGLRPWVFSFAAFLCYRAYDQIRVGLSQARQPVTLVGSHAGGLSGRNGKTHAALNDLAVMTSLPGVDVWAPADEGDLELAIDTIRENAAPAYVRLPRRAVPALPGSAAAWRSIGEPAPVTIVATGLGTHFAIEARDELAALGTRVAILHCPNVSAVPKSGVVAALANVERVIVVEDHTRVGGLASLLALAGVRVDAAIGWPEDWAGQSGDDDELRRLHGMAPAGIAARVRAVVDADAVRADPAAV